MGQVMGGTRPGRSFFSKPPLRILLGHPALARRAHNRCSRLLVRQVPLALSDVSRAGVKIQADSYVMLLAAWRGNKIMSITRTNKKPDDSAAFDLIMIILLYESGYYPRANPGNASQLLLASGGVKGCWPPLTAHALTPTAPPTLCSFRPNPCNLPSRKLRVQHIVWCL
ncbi:hypothetical protein E2C01_037837 [Portunus trituberculatus]|uniref:Uncharacterized protein n=1 Tax=Portunus trituberculatus TaxID=210409 RepID=A0A5B7FGD5_PORTR|nr:hypothetical protein [Portunus trituberculatus]